MKIKLTLEMIFMVSFSATFIEAQIIEIFCGGSSACKNSISQCDKFLQEALQIDLKTNDVSSTQLITSSPSPSQTSSPSESVEPEGNSTDDVLSTLDSATYFSNPVTSTVMSTSVTATVDKFQQCQAWSNIFNKCAIDVGIDENAITLNKGVDPCRNIELTNCTTKNSDKMGNAKGHKQRGLSKHDQKNNPHGRGSENNKERKHKQRFEAHERGHEQHIFAIQGRKHGPKNSGDGRGRKDQRESHGRKYDKGLRKDSEKKHRFKTCNVFGPDKPEREEPFYASLGLQKAEAFRKCKLEAIGFIKNDSSVNSQRLQDLSGKFIKTKDLQTKVQQRIGDKSCSIKLFQYKVFDYLKCIAEPCLRPK